MRVWMMVCLLATMGCARYEHRTLHGDMRFTKDERFRIVAAADIWRDCSGGRFDLEIVFDRNQPRLHERNSIIRGPAVGITDDRRARGFTNGGRIWLDPDSFGDNYNPDKLTALAAHEMGHLVGMDHVGDTDAIMAVRNVPRTSVAEADFAECQRVGLCE